MLEDFVKNRTTIIITHRLSTLALADRIVVMNGGRILDVGTHDELLDRCRCVRWAPRHPVPRTSGVS